MAFSDYIGKLRAPRLLTGGNAGSLYAGQKDAADEAISNLLLEQRLNINNRNQGYINSGRINQRPMGQIPVQNPNFGQISSSMGPTPGRMDVVYDQRPEMLTKQLNLQKRAMEMNQPTEADKVQKAIGIEDDYRLNKAKMALSERQVANQEYATQNPNMEYRDAGTEIAGINPRTGQVTRIPKTGVLSEEEKINRAFNNARAVEEFKGQNATNVANINSQGRIDAARIKDTTLSPSEQTTDISNRAARLVAQNPEFAKVLKFDPETNKYLGMAEETQAVGGGMFGKSDDGNVELRRRAAAALHGAQQPIVAGIGSPGLGGQVPSISAPVTGSINDNKGSDSSSLVPAAGQVDVNQIRDRAIAALKKNNKPVTEENIARLMAQKVK